jgi:hypothetical protein
LGRHGTTLARMRRDGVWGLAAVVAFVGTACGGATSAGGNTSLEAGAEGAPSSCTQGAEGCSCSPNSTCNAGLTCASKLCVNMGGTGGAGGTVGGGGGSRPDASGPTGGGGSPIDAAPEAHAAGGSVGAEAGWDGAAGLDGSADGGDGALPDSGTNRCTGLATAATGTAGLIDNFEDGNTTLLPNEGRNGTWSLAGDPGCTLAPSPLVPQLPVATTTKNTSNKALHVSGAGCTSYGFTVTTSLVANPISATENWECGYDVSAYDGIYFWATGTDAISVTVSVGMLSTVPKRIGGDGTCEPASGGGSCYDAWVSVNTISNNWQLVSFRWSDLMQAGWSGMAIPWNPKIVSEVAFSVGKDDTTTKADLWIDNVGFFKGAPPTTPP